MHPIRSYRNFKAACKSFIKFCLDSLEAIRALTSTIKDYELRAGEFHADLKKVEGAVGYLARAERHRRETQGQKVNV